MKVITKNGYLFVYCNLKVEEYFDNKILHFHLK
jgi:hypothetical protein